MSTTITNALLRPRQLLTANQLRSGSGPQRHEHGIYVWYFRLVPSLVPTDGCVVREGYTALYLGIAPSRPGSARDLKSRIRTHLDGDASQSTLRTSLGVVLGHRRCRDRRNRWTLGSAEEKLTDWMTANARLSWAATARPWDIEEDLIISGNYPLNLRGNAAHRFAPTLSKLRRDAKTQAPCRA